MDTGNNIDESEIICKKKPVSKCNILNIYIFSAFFFKVSTVKIKNRSTVARVWGEGRSCLQRGTKELWGMRELFYILIVVVAI